MNRTVISISSDWSIAMLSKIKLIGYSHNMMQIPTLALLANW